MELGDVSDALALAVCGVRCGARPYVIGHPGPCARVSPSGLPFDIALVSAMLSFPGDWETGAGDVFKVGGGAHGRTVGPQADLAHQI